MMHAAVELHFVIRSEVKTNRRSRCSMPKAKALQQAHRPLQRSGYCGRTALRRRNVPDVGP